MSSSQWSYVRGCEGVVEGVGGREGYFLFLFVRSIEYVSEWGWVIEGVVHGAAPPPPPPVACASMAKWVNP